MIGDSSRGVAYLPLGREVSVTGRDTEEEAVVLEELLGVVEGRDVGILGGSVHLGQDFLGESLGDLEDVDGTTGSLDTLLLSEGESLDVAVEGVL